MEKRSTYQFKLNCNPNTINNLIQQYLSANSFKLETKENEQYYKSNDSKPRYFKYNISNNVLTINAWFRNLIEEFSVEQADNDVPYRESLGQLFEEINKLNQVQMNNQPNFDPYTGQPINNMNNNQNMQQINQAQMNQRQNMQMTQNFQNQTLLKKEKYVNVSFGFAIFGLILSIFGLAYGLIFYAIILYYAAKGLNTRKRGKAIATIIISIISILIALFYIFVQNNIG